MNTTQEGREAEVRVSEHLVSMGHTIRALNWRTRYCEIDIVSQKGKTIFFTEVKYRKRSDQGTGLEYITVAKQKQMFFSAELWIAENNEPEFEYCLQGASVDYEGSIEIVPIY